MTEAEAQKLAELSTTIDSGCRYCCEEFVGQLNEAFPDFLWVFTDNGRAAMEAHGFDVFGGDFSVCVARKL